MQKKKLCTTRVTAEAIERNTRQQSESPTWHEERRHRLTSSQFGTVLIRKEWSLKGLENLTRQRDLSKVAAVKYGISNEPVAAQRYKEVLHNMGHDAVISSCGLLVSPSCPWLGASPDRIVFDPVEDSYGVVEIKCPYSLRDQQACNLPGLNFCCEVDENGPKLKRDHQYYAQLIGQMAISGLSWGDFVVYSKDFILIERVKFSQSEWSTMKETLDYFYFDTLLPYLETTM
ncbi:uncharacterized protein LOC135386925 [Ornithodoros turicata]|uniref:uncharacterized protein LOC135370423 n=1 Tax=Ornithodoros turicata TaxID=34597 RepID=UPI003139BBE2